MASAPQWPPAAGPAVGAPVLSGGTPEWVSLPVVAEACGGPLGLANALVESRVSTAASFWVVDNSGSMATADGSKLVHRQDGSYSVVRCTRWEELRDVVCSQAALALSTRSRIDFHLLNPPNTLARQFVSLGLESSSSCPSRGGAATLQDLTAALASTPTGSTPLTEAVLTIQGLLEGMAPTLRSTGQQVVVVLATDGLPNDPGSFVAAVSNLQRLGCVWLVVRLCTQSDQVLEYWNNLDSQLEAPLEVLDDAAGEAREIAVVNGWLTYGFPLHLIRTAGFRHKLFDLLDEQPFIGTQVAEMVALLFGCPPLPNPEADWVSFQQRLGVLLATNQPTYCPLSKKMKPWVCLEDLRSKFAGSEKKIRGLSPSPEYRQPPAPGTPGILKWTATAKKLPSMKTWSRNDPFYTISLWFGEGRYAFLANSEALLKTKEPKWEPLYLPLDSLKAWDPRGSVRIDVFDYEDDHEHQHIGYCWAMVDDLMERRTTEVELRRDDTKAKSRGFVTVSVESHT